MKKLIYISIVILAFNSCKKPQDRACYKSTGDTISETREITDFSTVILNDNIKLVLTQSAENAIEINSGENLINFIKTDVIDGILHISNQIKCNNLRSKKHEIIVNLNVKNLKRIEHYGTKGIQFSNTIKSDSLAIESVDGHGDVNINFEGDYLATIFHSGTCNVTSTGTVRDSFVYQISNGFTDNSGLSAKQGHLHSRTIQDCFMNIDSFLSVEIHGAGNVYYKENSDLVLESKLRGNGKLIPQ